MRVFGGDSVKAGVWLNGQPVSHRCWCADDDNHFVCLYDIEPVDHVGQLPSNRRAVISHPTIKGRNTASWRVHYGLVVIKLPDGEDSVEADA